MENVNGLENAPLEIPLTARESSYRNNLFKNDYSKLLSLDIRCTICNVDVMWMFLFKKQFIMHPVLEVIVCEGCLICLDTSDSNSGCVWCGKNYPRVTLVKCCGCTAQFCASCIKVNFGNSEFNCVTLMDNEGWFCYICEAVGEMNDTKEPRLWRPRAFCYAAQQFTKDLKRIDVMPEPAPLSECSICTIGCDRIVRLQCTHHFHEKCINQWIEKSRSCPNCRSTYVDAKVIHS